MTINPQSDGEPMAAPLINSLANAPNREGVLDGCTPSKGAGDWDVDIASGNIIIRSSRPSVSGQTVSLTAPSSDADLDAGEFRVDLVTIDSTGTASATEGTVATDPNAPDIPADEVLIASVLVSGNASSLTSADIFDYRTIVTPLVASAADDGGDITTHSLSDDSGGGTLISLATGGVLLGGFVVCGGTATLSANITVDGGTQYSISPVVANATSDPADLGKFLTLPSIVFSSSLTVSLSSDAGRLGAIAHTVS